MKTLPTGVLTILGDKRPQTLALHTQADGSKTVRMNALVAFSDPRMKEHDGNFDGLEKLVLVRKVGDAYEPVAELQHLPLGKGSVGDENNQPHTITTRGGLTYTKFTNGVPGPHDVHLLNADVACGSLLKDIFAIQVSTNAGVFKSDDFQL